MAWNTLGFDPGWGSTGQDKTGAAGYANSLIDQAKQAGTFDPLGSPTVNAEAQRFGLRSAESLSHRGGTLSRLLGVGPQEAQQSVMDTNRAASGGLANFLNDTRFHSLMGSQDFLKNLLSGQISFEHMKSLQQMLEDFQKSQSGGTAADIGTLLGAAGGAFLGKP